MLDLKNVTLYMVDCVNPFHAMNALKYSSRNINFGRLLLASHKKPSNLTNDVDFIKIPKINNALDSSIHSFDYLNDWIDTEFALVQHTDGFVIHPENWDDIFFEYDYIGAPWGEREYINRVGNGGFCLRSKKLIEFISRYSYNGKHADDQYICQEKYNEIVENGFVFAPPEIAIRFSIEDKNSDLLDNTIHDSFGFHGPYTPEAVRYITMIKQDFSIWETGYE